MEAWLPRVEALYRDYIGTVDKLEQNRKFGDGLFGLRPGPEDDPCHDRFAADLEGLLKDFLAASPESGECAAVLRYMIEAPEPWRELRCAYWMLLAVQGLTKELIPHLSPADADTLAERFEADYRPCDRLPAQNELLAALRKIGTGKPAVPRFSFLKHR